MAPGCNIDPTSVTAIRGKMFNKSVQFPPDPVSIKNGASFYKFIYRTIKTGIKGLKL
jgi:hypothetical protein